MSAPGGCDRVGGSHGKTQAAHMSRWHILVGSDGSEHADRALDVAHGLAA